MSDTAGSIRRQTVIQALGSSWQKDCPWGTREVCERYFVFILRESIRLLISLNLCQTKNVYHVDFSIPAMCSLCYVCCGIHLLFKAAQKPFEPCRTFWVLCWQFVGNVINFDYSSSPDIFPGRWISCSLTSLVDLFNNFAYREDYFSLLVPSVVVGKKVGWLKNGLF